MQISIPVLVATLAGVPAIVGGGFAAYDHFATKDDLRVVSDQAGKNEDSNFRLEQMIINSQRQDREERGLKPNPKWLQQQQRDLDYRRCLAQQRYNRKVRCNK